MKPWLIAVSGATVMDLGYVPQALAVDYVVNLDGGGSASMRYNGQ